MAKVRPNDQIKASEIETVMRVEKEELSAVDSQVILEYIRATIEILMKMKLEDIEALKLRK